MIESALIGTGSIGSQLLNQTTFSNVYNSTNITQLIGKRIHELIITAPYGIKFLANKDPKKDWENIAHLIAILKTVNADRVIVISSVDAIDCITPYGKHRRQFEQFCIEQFQAAVFRLPHVFGDNASAGLQWDMTKTYPFAVNQPRAGYTKTAFTDVFLLTDEKEARVQKPLLNPKSYWHPDAMVQIYPLRRLYHDITSFFEKERIKILATSAFRLGDYFNDLNDLAPLPKPMAYPVSVFEPIDELLHVLTLKEKTR